MWRGRLRFWFPVAVCWGAALGALYLHPAFWALFGLALAFFALRQVRDWSSE